VGFTYLQIERNPLLGGYHLQIPVLSALNRIWTPRPRTKFLVRHWVSINLLKYSFWEFVFICCISVFVFIYWYLLSSGTMFWIDVAYMCNTKQQTTAVDYLQNGTRTGIHLTYLAFPYTHTNPDIAPPSHSVNKGLQTEILYYTVHGFTTTLDTLSQIAANKEWCCTTVWLYHLWKCFLHKSSVFSWNLYTGCNRRNVPNFGRVFLMLNYTDITQNTYVQSFTVLEIMAIEKCGLLWGPCTVSCPWRHTRPLHMPDNAPSLCTAVSAR
jgi:hypothetical protein